jgi:hypothetical protein
MGMAFEAGQADVEDDETAEHEVRDGNVPDDPNSLDLLTFARMEQMQEGESDDNAAIEARPSQPNKKTKKKNKRAALMQSMSKHAAPAGLHTRLID